MEQKHATPSFLPHVTLLGGFEFDGSTQAKDHMHKLISIFKSQPGVIEEQQCNSGIRCKLTGSLKRNRDVYICVRFLNLESQLFPLRDAGLGIGQTTFQCVYVTIEKTNTLLKAFETAGSTMISDPEKRPTDYLPHLSLIYSDADQETRRAIKKDCEKELESFGDGFNVTALSLWETDINDKSTKSWKLVQKFPIIS